MEHTGAEHVAVEPSELEINSGADKVVRRRANSSVGKSRSAKTAASTKAQAPIAEATVTSSQVVATAPARPTAAKPAPATSARAPAAKAGQTNGSAPASAEPKAAAKATASQTAAPAAKVASKSSAAEPAAGADAAAAGDASTAGDRADAAKVPVLKILSIEPPVIRFHQAFKANWAIEVDHDIEVASAELTFQTDDARVVLYEHQGEPEAPVAKPVALWAGARIRKSTLLELRLRTGLVGEESRDGKMAPMSVHARLNIDNQRTLAVSTAFELQVADLSERQLTKILL